MGDKVNKNAEIKHLDKFEFVELFVCHLISLANARQLPLKGKPYFCLLLEEKVSRSDG